VCLVGWEREVPIPSGWSGCLPRSPRAFGMSKPRLGWEFFFSTCVRTERFRSVGWTVDEGVESRR
jgi:hypothetical protein